MRFKNVDIIKKLNIKVFDVVKYQKLYIIDIKKNEPKFWSELKVISIK